ncbi:MAG: glycosyltransferase [Bacteriovorax sp.]|nr:glycosyltransferase [Bacteriovorax sp.]
MNIVYVSDQYWPSVSGVPVSMDSFKDNFTQRGHKISLIVPDYPEAVVWDKEHNSKNIFRFRSRSIFFNKENRLVYKSEKKKIYERLDLIRPDIIHIHTEFALAKLVIKYAKKNNIPLVLTAHTNWEELINEYIKFIPHRVARFYCRSILRRIFNKVDVVIVPTTLMESRLNQYYIQSPIQVIPTGINVSHFSRNDEEMELTHNLILESLSERIKDHKTLLYVGRLGKEKNIKFLIDAFSQLVKSNSDIKLIIVGDGPAKSELENYTKQLSLDGRVIFTGYVQRNMLADFYSMAHIFIFASKVESQGLVILESMTCGTPVVAIGEMGTRALMASGDGGFMVDDDLDLFIEKVELLLNDTQIHKIKSAEALKESKNWGSDIMTSKVLTLYEDLLTEKRILHEIRH